MNKQKNKENVKQKKSKFKFGFKTEKIKLESEKIKDRDVRIEKIKLCLLLMLLFIITLYFLLRISYDSGNFTVSLDPKFSKESGLTMYEKLSEKQERKILKAQKVEFMDNISINWLPENLNELGEGSHNGEDYLAYTFYLENMGSDPINYWYEILIDDVIKNVDRAIRIMIYRNDEKTVYARPNEITKEAESGTEKFYSELSPVLECRENFAPGEIDKFTIVVFLEGDDPDCVDALIGGDMKMHMDIVEDHIRQENNARQENNINE